MVPSLLGNNGKKTRTHLSYQFPPPVPKVCAFFPSHERLDKFVLFVHFHLIKIFYISHTTPMRSCCLQHCKHGNTSKSTPKNRQEFLQSHSRTWHPLKVVPNCYSKKKRKVTELHSLSKKLSLSTTGEDLTLYARSRRPEPPHPMACTRSCKS